QPEPGMSTRGVADGVFPVLATSRLVLFPGMRCTVHLSSARAFAPMVAAVVQRDGFVAVFLSEINVRFEPDQLCAVGMVARTSSPAVSRVVNAGSPISKVWPASLQARGCVRSPFARRNPFCQ